MSIEERLQAIDAKVDSMQRLLSRFIGDMVETAEPEQKFMNIKEASEYSRLACQTLRIYAKDNKFRSTKVGKTILIYTDSLKEFLDEHNIEKRTNETLKRTKNVPNF